MRDRFGAVANFLVVYVREAHPTDEWAMEENAKAGVALAQPKSDAERSSAAALCCSSLAVDLPVVVDGVDDAVGVPYGAWPERMYVLDEAGVVLYRGGTGPWGFRPDEVEAVLRTLR